MMGTLTRAEAIQDEFISGHKDGLKLCDHIHIGIKNGIQHERIFQYCQWYYLNHIEYQFELEEKIIFPFLDTDESQIKKILSDHRKIKRIVKGKVNFTKAINQSEELLEQHIRFENKLNFNKIYASAYQLFGSDITKLFFGYNNVCEKEWEDKFWLE